MSVDHDDYLAKLQEPPMPRPPQDSEDEPDETTTVPDVTDENTDPVDADTTDDAADDGTDDEDVVTGVVMDTDADSDPDSVDDDDDVVTGVTADEGSPVTPVRTGGAHRYPLPAFPAPDAPSTGASPSFTPAAEATVPDEGDSQASWQRIKAGFVDDPRASVEEAAAIVEEAAETLVATIQERERLLRGAWEGNGTDTEKLRTAFQDYRELYDKISQV